MSGIGSVSTVPLNRIGVPQEDHRNKVIRAR